MSSSRVLLALSVAWVLVVLLAFIWIRVFGSSMASGATALVHK